MSNEVCAHTKDHLPEYAAGVLAADEARAVEAHLGVCADCRAELELVRALRSTRPDPDPALAAKVQAAVRSAPRRSSRTVWTWSAAATVVLALGAGLVWNRVNSQPAFVLSGIESEGEFWPGDEVLVAGALVFDDMSEEELAAFLEGWDDDAS